MAMFNPWISSISHWFQQTYFWTFGGRPVSSSWDANVCLYGDKNQSHHVTPHPHAPPNSRQDWWTFPCNDAWKKMQNTIPWGFGLKLWLVIPTGIWLICLALTLTSRRPMLTCVPGCKHGWWNVPFLSAATSEIISLTAIIHPWVSWCFNCLKIECPTFKTPWFIVFRIQTIQIAISRYPPF